jgi:hypothetical protein
MTDEQPPTPPPPPPAIPGLPTAPARLGTVGQPRSALVTILLTFVTCGIWHLFWTYWVFDENQKYSGQGVGGLVGLLIGLFCGIVNVFLLPNEVEKLYANDGRTSPVSAITGLWILLPLVGFFVWQVKVQHAINDFWVSKGALPV